MPNARPNVLFLLSDEHSFRFFSCLPESEGGEPARTPTLDEFATLMSAVVGRGV